MGNKNCCTTDKDQTISGNYSMGQQKKLMTGNRLKGSDSMKIDHLPFQNQAMACDQLNRLDKLVVERYEAADKPDFENHQQWANYEYFPERGPYKYPDGSTYLGQYKLGLKHGLGKLIWPNGAIYHGYFVDDQAHGIGIMVHLSGDVYSGEWEQDVCHGEGDFHDYKEGSHYSGQWHNGVKHGKGELTEGDGTVYTGSFNNGTKHGKGQFSFKNGTTYKGDFEQDDISGDGEFTWPDGRKFIGQWKENLMHGQGKFTWPDDRYYEGEYVNGKKEGFGKFKLSNGCRYEGDWKNGVQDGEGIFFKKDDDFGRRGIWEKGKRKQWVSDNKGSILVSTNVGEPHSEVNNSIKSIRSISQIPDELDELKIVQSDQKSPVLNSKLITTIFEHIQGVPPQGLIHSATNDHHHK